MLTTGLAALAAMAMAPAAAAAQSPLVDDSKADFSGGAAGAATWAVEPGSVRLMPTGAAANFESGLGDWAVTEWTTGAGSGAAAGGTLTLDGVRAHAAPTYLPPRVLEFRADFDNEAFQHVGFGDTLGDANQPWAIISTGSDGTGLFARTQNANGVTVAVPTPITLPDPFDPHTFRIEWSQTAVRYFVDGGTAPVAEHAVDFGAMTQLRPIASDATPGGATPKVLKVDWLGMSPSPSSGAFVSRVHDAGDPRAVWGTLAAIASAGVSFETRSGNTSTPDGTWSEYQPVTGGAVQSPSGRYIQYRATLDAADASVDRVAISYALDETAPNATTIAGVDVSGTTATLRFASTDTDVARFECKLDGGDFATCTSPKQFTGLAAGSHTASVRAIDKAGNVGQAVSQAFTVASSTGTGTPPTGGGGPKPPGGTPADTKAPIVTIGARSLRVSKRAVIRLKCPADETKCTISVRLKYGRKTAGQKTVTVAGGKTVKAKVLLSSAARTRLATRGRLNVTAIVTARDAAGNTKRREFAMTLRPF